MSAFVVDPMHIDLLVDVAIRGPRGAEDWYGPRWKGGAAVAGAWQRADAERADAIGMMLLAENVRSVRHLYADADRSGLIPRGDYRWTDRDYRMTAEEALKALLCYNCQASECPDWMESEAWRFSEALKDSLIWALDGVDGLPWEWTERTLKEARQTRSFMLRKQAKLTGGGR